MSSATAPSIPGSPKRNWHELLPAPFDSNPIVVVVMAPTNSTYVTRAVKTTGVEVGFIRYEDKDFPIHILDPANPNYFKQRQTIRELNVDFMPPAYVGSVSDIPQKLLMTADWSPIMLLRENMHEVPGPIKMLVEHITKPKDKN